MSAACCDPAAHSIRGVYNVKRDADGLRARGAGPGREEVV